MTVLRIVTNIATANVLDVRKFYSDLFGLDAEGGSSTPVPNLSIEVDNVNEVYLPNIQAKN